MSSASVSGNAEIVPVKRLVYNPNTGKHEQRAPAEKFIKGPIPVEWISRANALPGKAGAVGLALWFLVGVRGAKVIKLTGEIERIAACKRQAKYQALTALEEAGLISVKQTPGARATVTILDKHP
jgi:hypothetical protein